jgi:uncharacterized protein YbbK (DUF523 family)
MGTGADLPSERDREGCGVKAPVLVSACLLGVDCRYDGWNCLDERVTRLAKRMTMIPVCPEQLGGLGTPRPPVRIVGGSGSDILDGRARVVDEEGADVTERMLRGARQILRLARVLGVGSAIMKARSPSCGCGEIEGGGGQIITGDGVASALLKREGIRVITEDELKE